MEAIIITVHVAHDRKFNAVDIEYNTDDGIETLAFQIVSLAGLDMNTGEIVLVDKFGREIIADEDIDDVKFCSSSGEEVSSCYVAELWFFLKSSAMCYSQCTTIIPDLTNTTTHAIDLTGAVQSCYRFLDMPFQICEHCRHFFDPSLIVSGTKFPSSVSGTATAGNGSGQYLHCFRCDIDKLIEFGIAAPHAEDALKANAARFLHGAPMQTPILLYLRRQLMERALQQLRDCIPHSQNIHTSPGYREFKGRVESGARTVLVYEDPAQQAVARQHIDYAKVYEYALIHMGIPAATTTDIAAPAATSSVASVSSTATVAAEGSPPSHSQAQLPPFSKEVAALEERALLVGLMRWFKLDFFKWCNKPACDNPLCGAAPGRMDGAGAVEPSAEEKSIGWASRTELYKCRDCAQITRFARFNNPAHLLTTRRGRCGEFANAFCLICRALHLDARYVLDFTDHVWCEVWLPSEQRFAHCDPCERALDTPLMYELGWNKKLTHLLSFSRYGVVDALPRYSRKQNTVLVRRSAEVVNESFVAEIIAVKDKELEVGFAMRRVSLPVPTGVVNMHTTGGGLPWDVPIEGRVDASSQRGSSTATPLRMVVQGKAAVDSLCGEDVTWETLQHRKRLQQRELHALRLNTDITSATFTRQGRISGDLDWKLSRGEAGEATAVLATGDGAGAVCDPNAALCATGDAVVASKGAQILSIPPPAWMKALPSGVELVLTPHPSISSSAASGITDIIIATHRHQLLVNAVSQEQQKGLTTPAAADCYGWGGGLLPRVACVGETWVQLGSTGKSFSIGTDASATSTARIHSLPLNALGGAAQQGVGEVMLTKNGVTDPQPVPQYVAFRTVTATSNLGVKGANEENAQPQLLPLEGYTCSVPARILFPPEGDKSISGLTLLAKTQCLKDKSYLGFTVVADGKNNSSESSHAVLFGAAGYPLEALAGAVTYVKVISTTQQEQKKQEWKQQLLGSLSINNISDEGKGPALPQCSDRDGGCGGAEVVHAPSDADRAPAAVGATPAWDATTLCARRSYYHLGGAFHNDTVPFDSSAFLQAFNVVTNKTHCKSSCSGPDAFAEGPAVIRLSKIVVFAGENLVNGVQCTFELTFPFQDGLSQSVCVTSPLCSSDCDSPTARVLEIPADDRVESVLCRSGALVDYLEIRTARGGVLRAGGCGGGDTTLVTVPDSAIPCGFFGGTGGHLHNVGVVLLDSFVPQQDKRDLPDQHRDQGQQQDQTSQEENGEPTIGGTTAEKAVPCVPDEPDTPTAVMRPPHSEAHLLVSLLQLCESMETSGCGMLNYYSKPSLESYRQSNIGHFAELLHAVVRKNIPEVTKACLKTITAYADNIIKDPLERKYQSIKITNAHLRQSVLQASGGLQLLCFGPAAFRLALSTTGVSAGQYVLQSAVAAEVLVVDKSALFRATYVSWLRKYVQVLKAVVDKL